MIPVKTFPRSAFPVSLCVALGLSTVVAAGEAQAPPLATEEIVRRAMPGIVEVRVAKADGDASGSGFLIRQDGLVVTNFHVVDGATRISIRIHGGETYDQVRVRGFDRKRDLVILKVPAVGLPALPTSGVATVAVGSRVVAIGHPSGMEDTVTSGIVSNVRVLENGVKVVQTDAAASPGNSGGPLLNDRGEVIGIVSYGIFEKSLNFAIPVDYALGLLEIDSLLSLEQFRAQSGVAEESLFGIPPNNGPGGRWISLNSATLRVLRQDGDFLVGAVEAPAEAQFTATYDLHKLADGTFTGVVRWRQVCLYDTNPMADMWWQSHQRSTICEGKDSITLRLVSKDRIEGSMAVRKPKSNSRGDIRTYCKSQCSEGYVESTEEFVWTRAN